MVREAQYKTPLGFREGINPSFLMLINNNNHRQVMNKFYVYVFLRQDRFSPYYVGKGCGRRAWSNTGRKVRVPSKDRVVIIKDKLTEEEAFQLERTLIKFWGRKCLGEGVLLNLSEGGEGGPTGSIRTETQLNNHRKAMQKVFATKSAWNKGKKFAPGTFGRPVGGKGGGGGAGRPATPFIFRGQLWKSTKECYEFYGVCNKTLRKWRNKETH